jgi:hypothetical protein
LTVTPVYPKGATEELLSYVPSFYRDITEFVAIQEAAAKEISVLFEAIQLVADDSNILTAQEKIIKYFEDIIGINYSSQRTLEERRRLVLVYYNIFGKVSGSRIERALSYYTEAPVEVDFDTRDEDKNYILEIKCERGKVNSLFLEDISLLCKKIIPAHLLYRVALLYKVDVVVALKKKEDYQFQYELCGTKPYSALLGNINDVSVESESLKQNINFQYIACNTEESGVKNEIALIGDVNGSQNTTEIVHSNYQVTYSLCGTKNAGQ